MDFDSSLAVSAFFFTGQITVLRLKKKNLPHWTFSIPVEMSTDVDTDPKCRMSPNVRWLAVYTSQKTGNLYRIIT